jgi:hypothetical protein
LGHGANKEALAIGSDFIGTEDEVVDGQSEQRVRGRWLDRVGSELDADGHQLVIGRDVEEFAAVRAPLGKLATAGGDSRRAPGGREGSDSKRLP